MLSKTIGAALATLAIFATAAQASDLPVKARYGAPYAHPSSLWNGFYVGVNAGYAWGMNTSSREAPPITTSP